MTDGSELVRPFPMPLNGALARAYQNLYTAETGTDQQKKALGNPAMLPRPWDPGTITDPGLLRETWNWFDDVVDWFNHEYVWNLGVGYIPACWPHHPHLVHEIAVLADQRRRAGIALSSDLLEEWHRYTVPNFLDRLQRRIHDACEPDHTDWPARTKYARTRSSAAARRTPSDPGREPLQDGHWRADPPSRSR